MNHPQRLVTFLGAALCTLGLLAGESFAQAAFQEGFDNNGLTQEGDDGPINLIKQEWIFSNQSEPLGSTDWFDGVDWPNLITPHEGAGFLAAGFSNVDLLGTISNWAVLPTVPEQAAGDVLTFYTISGATGKPDRLQVWYSSNGGTGTGVGPNDTGDFDVLLLDIDPVPNYNEGPFNGWTRHEIALSGNGRIALRYFVTDAGLFGPNATYLGVDTLSVAPPVPSEPLPEDFDSGEQELLDNGWLFINQSEPDGGGSGWEWAHEPLAFPEPHQGIGYIATDVGAGLWGGAVSTWAVLPETPGLQAGDVLSFFLYTTENFQDIHFEVRLSPTGGGSTGTGAQDVGDFTELLLSLDPPEANQAWNLIRVDLTGSGRLALRYHAPDVVPFSPSARIGVDTLGINVEIPGPPIPLPGETVTWTLADSPYILDSDIAIPIGGTVIVEPGVSIEINEDQTLLIDGTMIAHGTTAAPISFTGNFSLVHPSIHVFGTLDMAFAQVSSRVHGDNGCSVLVSDCTFPAGIISTDEAGVVHEPQYVQIDRCTFPDGGRVSIWDGTLVIRDTTFQQADPPPPTPFPTLSTSRGYVRLDNVALDGGYYSHHRERSPQTAYINNLTVLNNPQHAAIVLRAWDFFLGPDNVIQNNLYPLQLVAGLDPSSTLPSSGNINNYIWNSSPTGGLPGVAGRGTWPDLGIPYVVDGFNTSGDITFLPGATVQFPQFAGLAVAGTRRIRTLGLPDNPVVFQAFSPGVQWDGFGVIASSMTRKLEHIVVEGASTGVIASGTLLNIENSILRNNGIGSQSNSGGLTRIRKTRIFDNGVGAQGSAGGPGFSGKPDLFGQTNPNWIEGNGIGVQELDSSSEIDARFNYWGDPSGPTTPSNPGGTGDPVEGPGFVTYSPFLTALPDFNDHPPIVRLTDPAVYAETGETKMISWDVIEDGAVISQRVLFTPAFGHPFQVLADNLPGDQRAFEFTVPFGNPGGGPNGPAWIKVEAVDNAGQIGWDETFFSVPNEDITPDSDYFLTNPITGTLTMGEQRDEICWDFTGVSGSVSLNLVLDADQQNMGLGGSTTLCLSGRFNAPYVSTDTARIQIVVGYSTLGNRVFFSDYFSIRPDPRLGDEPPTVQMLTPTAGQAFEGETVVPITWSASDDEGLRSFDIQVSYDGGRGWQYVARNLPPEATSFDWLTAPSVGVPDVRARVIVRDLRFQNSSDGTNVVFSITPGDGGVEGDLDGDGEVGAFDLALLLGSWGPCGNCGDCPADLDGDCTVGAADLAMLLGNWG
ncbi:MAG: choice-of-anchor J domain-containing protein [Planctomycetes bacterium]|nr:choice-of-anchor J domain-containing protein [Planctomycetota bacterium]